MGDTIVSKLQSHYVKSGRHGFVLCPLMGYANLAFHHTWADSRSGCWDEWWLPPPLILALIHPTALRQECGLGEFQASSQGHSKRQHRVSKPRHWCFLHSDYPWPEQRQGQAKAQTHLQARQPVCPSCNSWIHSSSLSTSLVLFLPFLLTQNGTKPLHPTQKSIAQSWDPNSNLPLLLKPPTGRVIPHGKPLSWLKGKEDCSPTQLRPALPNTDTKGSLRALPWYYTFLLSACYTPHRP